MKLEKEIELEETLLNASGLEEPINTPKSCRHHEELHEAVSNRSALWTAPPQVSVLGVSKRLPEMLPIEEDGVY